MVTLFITKENGGHIKRWNLSAPVDTPGSMAFWSERVELKDFQQFYDEWVLNSIAPKVLIDNCPEQNISENSYDVNWSIVSGNADINYLFIGYYKNGEYDTRVFFEKLKTQMLFLTHLQILQTVSQLL